ncbi:MAG TPA: urease accessory protein UreE [Chitinophagaceae bacterium]|nr:urease accessory protein UreE [Chitinophagaceae bacterium]
MFIQQKTGNINLAVINNRTIDWLALEWYESNKRIQRKRTQSGQELLLKFLNENPLLTEGDILYEDEQIIIAVTILPCEAIVLKPKNMFEMASACYEIGNKHLPLFFEDDEILVPFEMPLSRLLTAQGYEVKQEKRKLLQPLKTTVSPHTHNNESLFSKIMKLTSPDE